jgi:hypothetical protein
MGQNKAFGKLVGNWKIIELFESKRQKIMKISAIRKHLDEINHQLPRPGRNGAVRPPDRDL